MSLLEKIKSGWSWKGVEPARVLRVNDFGNVLFEDIAGLIWRLCPEDLSCEVVANDRAQLDELSRDDDFVQDWNMTPLVTLARGRLGPLQPGYKYCLKIAAPLGGAYSGDNLGVITHLELVEASGSLARQIDGLPDGATIELKTTD